MPKTIVDTNVELAYEVRGSGKKVLLISGMGMPKEIWESTGLVDSLVNNGHEVCWYDSRGVGESSAPQPPYTVENLATDAVGLVDHLGWDDFSVVGYSMGSYASQRIALEHAERINRLALISGVDGSPLSPLISEMELDLINRLGEVPPTVLAVEQMLTTLPLTALQNREQAQAWAQIFAQSSNLWSSPDGLAGQLAASAAWGRHREQNLENLTHITAPTLVVAFSQDIFFPPDDARCAAESMQHAVFRLVTDAAHGGLMSKADEVISLLNDFMSGRDDAELNAFSLPKRAITPEAVMAHH